MVERRLNKPEAPSNAASPEAPAALPSLEQRAVAALTDTTLTAALFAVLVEETNSALIEAEHLAEAEKARAFDPVVSPDPKAAHAAMIDASFAADRLRTLLPRLRARLAEAAVRERSLEWLAERNEFEEQWLDRVVAARTAYESALNEMLSFFQLISDFTSARSVLLGARPDQCGMETVADPVPAPRVLSDTKLFDFNATQVWPDPRQINRFAVEMSNSVLAQVSSGDRDATGPNWWRAVARRQAAAAEEAELQGKRFAAMKVEQEARLNAEERERFAAAHGGGVK